mmetsp:Transcript_22086/g.48029  ORF Transcript_22086/g.48029 Transcript_22086/m.48029 type:complete len:245 (-) Transcript_22086:260-994(-)
MEPTDTHPSTIVSSSAAIASNPFKSEEDAPLESEETDVSTSKSNAHRQLKTSLQGADEEYAQKRRRIEDQIDTETRQLIESLERKKSNLLNAAKSEHKQMKSSILQSAAPSSAGNCSLCDTSMKIIAAAQCIGKDCSGTFCKSCLKHKIGDHLQCHSCSDIINVMCPTCVKMMNEKRGWYQFDYCKEGCGFICPEHTRVEDCCVCGRCPLCSSSHGSKCSLRECDRCGEKLCDRCDYKEGCMCR